MIIMYYGVNMRNFMTYFVFYICIILFVLNIQSCASKPPVLYQAGKPLAIIEYEKIAQNEFDKKKYKNAIAAYDAIIKNYADNTRALVWAHYEIGFCYYVQKKYEMAEKYFRLVINDFQEPAARKLAQDRIASIVEAKKK